MTAELRTKRDRLIKQIRAGYTGSLSLAEAEKAIARLDLLIAKAEAPKPKEKK